MFPTLILTAKILLWPIGIAIIGLILLQGGAGDISSAFGGGGQLDSTLGVGAGRKMARLTGYLAAGFILIVLFLAIRHSGSLLTPTNGLAGSHGPIMTAPPTPGATPPATVTQPATPAFVAPAASATAMVEAPAASAATPTPVVPPAVPAPAAATPVTVAPAATPVTVAPAPTVVPAPAAATPAASATPAAH